MALISCGYDLTEFFCVKGEAVVRPNRPRFVVSEIRSPLSDGECRKRKRLRYHTLFGEVQQDGENYRGNQSCMTQNFPSESSSVIDVDEEMYNLLVSRNKDSAIRHEVKQSQNIVQQIKKRISRDHNTGSSGLQLVCFLLNCASAVAENNKGVAEYLLSQLHNRVTMTGNSIQRVAAHFAEALSTKLKPATPSFFHSKLIATHPDEKEYSQLQFEALIAFYRVSPFYQFAHLTANQAIIEAFEGQSHLHIIDFDISHGIQWSSLIQSLSERKNVPALRITGFGRDMNLLNATGISLRSFANSYGLASFEFHPFVEGSKEISIENLEIKEVETVAVNLVLYLNRLSNARSDIIYSRLRCIQSLKPAIVAVVEHETSHSPTTFLSRFMESLHYYAALFDSLDEHLPLQSVERLRIERFHFGEQIKNSITDDGVDDMTGRRETHEKWETWKARMERAGFVQVGLSSRCASQAKLLLQARQQCNSFEGGGFRVDEKDVRKILSLAWQDRPLILASAWRCKT